MYHLKYRECLFYVLRKWRVIVVIMLLVGLLFTGRNALKTKNNWNNMQNDVDITNEYAKNKEDRIAELNDRIGEVYALIEERELFAAHNAPFTYDAENMYYSYAIMKFDFGKEDVLDEEGNVIDEADIEMPTGFLKVYQPFSKQVIDWEKVQTITGLTEEYVEDFVVRWTDADNELAYIACIASEEEVANDMLDYVVEQIVENVPKKMVFYGDFEIKMVATYTEQKLDKSLLKLITTEQGHTDSLREEIAGYEAEIAELTMTPTQTLSMPSTSKVAMSMVKHFVFGAAVGVVVAICGLYALFFLNGKLHSESELSFYCNAFLHSFISDNRKKKLKGIDKLIANAECNNILYTQNDAIHRTLANIKNSNEDVKSVMIIGTFTNKEKESISKSVADLKDLGLNVSVEGDILMDIKAFDNLKKYDAVVLVESLDKTSVDLIVKTINQVVLENKKVVGCLINR